MPVKWNKVAVKQLFDALAFIEQNDFYSYAEELENAILSKVRNLPQNPHSHSIDKYKKNNDESYRAFEVDRYRISYRYKNGEVRILRVRHTSRRPRSF